jgi:hypothetical protein
VMIHDMDLPLCLWIEDFNIVTYSKILKDKAPEEAFINEKLEVSLVCVFDCPVYIHVPKEKRTKVESFNIKGRFVGQNSKSIGFMF